MKWVAANISKIRTFFDNDPILKEKLIIAPHYADKDTIYNDVQVPLQLVYSNPRDYVWIGGDKTARYVMEQDYMDIYGMIPFRKGKDDLTWNVYSLFLQKDALYKKSINLAIMKWWENGFIKRIEEKTWSDALPRNRRAAIKENRLGEPPNSGKIDINHILGGLIILCIGYISASLVLFVEKSNKWLG